MLSSRRTRALVSLGVLCAAAATALVLLADQPSAHTTLAYGRIPSAVPTCEARLTRPYGPVFCGHGGGSLNVNAWNAAVMGPVTAFGQDADPNHLRHEGRVTPAFALWTLCGNAMSQNEVMGREVSWSPATIQEYKDIWSTYAAYYQWKQRELPLGHMKRQGCFGVYKQPGT